MLRLTLALVAFLGSYFSEEAANRRALDREHRETLRKFEDADQLLKRLHGGKP
jgi:hypothetical protein